MSTKINKDNKPFSFPNDHFSKGDGVVKNIPGRIPSPKPNDSKGDKGSKGKKEKK